MCDHNWTLKCEGLCINGYYLYLYFCSSCRLYDYGIEERKYGLGHEPIPEI